MPKQGPPSWRPPAVSVGDIVVWYPHGLTHLQGHPAVVCDVGHLALRIRTLGDYLQALDGVRHIEDPDCPETVRAEYGGWDHTQQTKEFHEFRGRIKQIIDEFTPARAS